MNLIDKSILYDTAQAVCKVMKLQEEEKKESMDFVEKLADSLFKKLNEISFLEVFVVEKIVMMNKKYKIPKGFLFELNALLQAYAVTIGEPLI